jgi:hypothetical protein
MQLQTAECGIDDLDVSFLWLDVPEWLLFL